MRGATTLWAVILSSCAMVSSGCGGHYILTIPDQAAPAGRDAPVVVRVQRNDFFVLSLAVQGAPMRFRIDGGRERGAFTDKLGYAGTMVPVPSKPGRYRLAVALQDLEGDEPAGEALVYSWLPDRPVLAVDLDCLPAAGGADAAAARAALRRLRREANVLYLTRRPVRQHRRAHAELEAAGLPDGPVLLWQRRRWHIVRAGRYRLPRVVVEARLVSQLSEVRRMFPGLTVGVCRSPLAARAFAEVGVRPAVVGPAEAAAPNAIRRASWAELAEKGL